MNSIIKRNQSEKRFKFYGILAVATAIFLLMILLFKIFSTGITAFKQTYIGVKIQIEANSDVSNLDPRRELKRNLRVMFPDAKTRKEKKDLYSLCLLYTSPSPRD